MHRMSQLQYANTVSGLSSFPDKSVPREEPQIYNHRNAVHKRATAICRKGVPPHDERDVSSDMRRPQKERQVCGESLVTWYQLSRPGCKFTNESLYLVAIGTIQVATRL